VALTESLTASCERAVGRIKFEQMREKLRPERPRRLTSSKPAQHDAHETAGGGADADRRDDAPDGNGDGWVVQSSRRKPRGGQGSKFANASRSPQRKPAAPANNMPSGKQASAEKHAGAHRAKSAIGKKANSSPAPLSASASAIRSAVLLGAPAPAHANARASGAALSEGIRLTRSNSVCNGKEESFKVAGAAPAEGIRLTRSKSASFGDDPSNDLSFGGVALKRSAASELDLTMGLCSSPQFKRIKSSSSLAAQDESEAVAQGSQAEQLWRPPPPSSAVLSGTRLKRSAASELALCLHSDLTL